MEPGASSSTPRGSFSIVNTALSCPNVGVIPGANPIVAQAAQPADAVALPLSAMWPAHVSCPPMRACFVQVLGEGELSKPLTIKAAKFSSSAAEKIAAAGATAEAVPQRSKWTRRAHERVRLLLLSFGF